jgi:threonyl-tRNA synthetase
MAIERSQYNEKIGAKESESNTLAWRSRKDSELGTISVEEVVEKLSEEIKMKRL